MVTSPEPVMSTLEEPLSLVNPTEVSTGMRPRQSKTIVRGKLIATPDSTEKFCVVGAPVPLKSIVTEYVVPSTCPIVAVPCRLTASARARSTYAANWRAEFESRMPARAVVILRNAKLTTMATTAMVIRSCGRLNPD